MKKNNNSVILVHHSLAVLITWKTKPYREGRKRNRVTPLFLDDVGTRSMSCHRKIPACYMGTSKHLDAHIYFVNTLGGLRAHTV